MVDALPILADVCERECARGVLGIAYQIGNQGLADMRAEVAVSVYAVNGDEKTLIETSWTEDLTPGGWTSDGFVLRLDLESLPDQAIEISVDDDGTGTGLVTECDEDNNTRTYDLSVYCDRYQD